MPIPDTPLNPPWFERTLAAIHLLGVVPTLGPLVAHDDAAATLAGSKPWSLGIRLVGGPSVILVHDGSRRLTVVEQAPIPPAAFLTFLTPGHLNRLFRREPSAIPPFTLRGLFHLDLARKFEGLMELAETFLRPDGPGADQLAIRVPMLLEVARGGLLALSRYDGEIAETLASVPAGLATVGLVDGPAFWIDTAARPWTSGSTPPPRKVDVGIQFRTPAMAAAAFDNTLDPTVAVGRGDIRIHGWLPLADALNHLLDRLQPYLLPTS